MAQEVRRHRLRREAVPVRREEVRLDYEPGEHREHAG
jgi:hypothetical protein